MPHSSAPATTLAPPAGWKLLVETDEPCTHNLRHTIQVDHRNWGAVSRRGHDGVYWRALHFDEGLLLLSVAPGPGFVRVRAWAPPDSTWLPEQAHELLVAWVGLRDQPQAAEELFAAHPITRALSAVAGPVYLSWLPDCYEAIGRAILGQLVQVEEAQRSTAQLVALVGSPIGGVTAWPRPDRLRSTPAWQLRNRAGISLKGARALHDSATDHRKLQQAASQGDWVTVDTRMRAIPGVGVWTSGEARLALGDPDGVAFGDWHLPTLVGASLSEESEPTGGWTDAHMAELLQPFCGQRGRAIRLLMRASRRKAGEHAGRKAPRSALSAHRYW